MPASSTTSTVSSSTPGSLPRPSAHAHHGERSAVAHESKANATTAMRGEGFYNKHSQQQAAALQSGLEVLREAMLDIPAHVFAQRTHVTFCDFGASQGRNSVPPSRAFVDLALQRGARAVHVLHQDLPSNDFNSLIRLMHSDEGYTAGRENVFTFATGGDFHHRVVADGSLVVGWSSTSCNWLTRPSPLRGAIVNVTADASTPGYQALVDLAASDWASYVKCREAELVAGGQLVQVEAARDESGSCGCETYFNSARGALLDALGEDAAAQVSIPMYIRSLEELKAPFANGTVPGLRLRETRFVRTPDALLAMYNADGNLDAHAARMIGIFKAAIAPGLKLDRFDAVKVEDFYAKFADRIKQDPQGNTVAWHVVVLRAEKVAPESPKPETPKSPLAMFNPFRRRG